MKRKEASLSTEIGERILFVSLRRNHLLAAVETGRADVVTTMHFTGRSFDSGGRVGQKVVSTVITALVGGFLVLLNSHGKPHVINSSVLNNPSRLHSFLKLCGASGNIYPDLRRVNHPQ